MVQYRKMYGILTWGFYYHRIEKLQKLFVSSIKYNAHSEPKFKVRDILKIKHLFSQSCTHEIPRLTINNTVIERFMEFFLD